MIITGQSSPTGPKVQRYVAEGALYVEADVHLITEGGEYTLACPPGVPLSTALVVTEEDVTVKCENGSSVDLAAGGSLWIAYSFGKWHFFRSTRSGPGAEPKVAKKKATKKKAAKKKAAKKKVAKKKADK